MSYLITTVLTIIAVSMIGIFSNKKAAGASGFTLGNRSFNMMRVGTSIAGVLIGGASTIGASQLAYISGVNGMLYTLGASVGCILLGSLFSKTLREENVSTVPEFIEKYYGRRAMITSSIASSFAIFVHVNSLILSAEAILSTIFNVGSLASIVINGVLICTYVIFGGFLGSSKVSLAKTALLYITLIYSLVFVVSKYDAIHLVMTSFDYEPWFNMLSGGAVKAIGKGIGVAVGVCSTQSYLQAVFAGKDVKASRNGCYLAAILCLPIGAICTLIGMFMKLNHPDIASSQALPMFVTSYLNPGIGGVVIGTLIICVVATAAGLSLGISTMVSRDLYKEIINKDATSTQQIRVQRIVIIVVVAVASVIVSSNLGTLILNWAFLSMTLRGTVAFVPIAVVVFLRKYANEKACFISMIVSPLVTFICNLFKLIDTDPLYIGFTCSAIIFIMYGVLSKDKNKVIHN